MPTETHRPVTATYRLQLHPGFTLDDAAVLAPQLAALGVSHLYCSPYLASAPGSTHGYDVVDHSRVDDELGGEAAHRRLADALRSAGLGQVLDIVPNHMTVGATSNRAWWSVLRDGRDSPYAGWFDIDWERHGARVLLPILGDPLDRVLERGELTISRSGEEPVLRYFDHVVPLASDPQGDIVTPEVLAAQHFLLAHWREVTTSLNYRRFFDVTTLAGLRVEDPDVFRATHERVLGWLADGTLDGIRIDHPDGLADPSAYLDRVSRAAPGAWIVVEKILEPGEDLRPWPVAGTTGYDALAVVQGVFVDPAAEEPLTAIYGELTGAETDYSAVAVEARLQVLREVLVPEVDRITGLLSRVCDADPALRPRSRDVAGDAALGDTVRSVLATFPVYRTYVTYQAGATEADRLLVEAALVAARSVKPSPDPDVLEVLRRVLLAEQRGPVEEELLVRWQQTTGPAMAKGVEDTTFYRYHRLSALNEVGGDPHVVGLDPDEFHDACLAAQHDWPLRMTTLTTHDTKRSEDTRARLIALAEMPAAWARLARGWYARHELARPHDRPDRNIAYLLFQTMVAAHPLSEDRAVAYLEKASREAKQHTSWVDPDPAYDEALRRFVTAVLGHDETQAEIAHFVAAIEPYAHTVSLAQKLVQLTMPGVPDVYQGCELWDHSLVDPDNRRPVDHALRADLIASLDGLGVGGTAVGEICRRDDVGLPKLHVVRTALRLRRDRPESFGADGAYLPLTAHGPKADHCLAFGRATDVITVVPRLPVSLSGDWQGTTLPVPAGAWFDVLSGSPVEGGSVPVAQLLAHFPVALLTRGGRTGATT